MLRGSSKNSSIAPSAIMRACLMLIHRARVRVSKVQNKKSDRFLYRSCDAVRRLKGSWTPNLLLTVRLYAFAFRYLVKKYL